MLTPRHLSHQEYCSTILAPLGEVVQDMERQGVCISLPKLKEIEIKASSAAGAHLTELTSWAGRDLNWRSWKQLAGFLHDELKLPLSPYCKKGAVQPGKISTDDKALEWLIDHCKEYRGQLSTLREYRRALRIVNYCETWAAMAIPGEGVRRGVHTLHPNFGLATDQDDRPGAVTGRFAVKNPALNQVPANKEKDRFGIRQAFVGPEGYCVVACDASQLEIVLLAHKASVLFGTTILAGKLRRGGDLHVQTAKAIYGDILRDAKAIETPEALFKKDPYTNHLRSSSKNVRYGLHYRKTKRGFGSSLFDTNGDAIGEEAAGVLVDAMYAAEPELKMLHDFGEWWTRKYGYTSSGFGRWTRLEGWNSRSRGEQNRAFRREANWFPQTLAQEILALALIGIHQDTELAAMGYQLSLPVHDEIVGICPEKVGEEAAARVSWHISNAVKLEAPLGASGGPGASWAEAKAA